MLICINVTLDLYPLGQTQLANLSGPKYDGSEDITLYPIGRDVHAWTNNSSTSDIIMAGIQEMQAHALIEDLIYEDM